MADVQPTLTPEQIAKQNEMRKLQGLEPLATPAAATTPQPNTSVNPEVKDITEEEPVMTVELMTAQLEQQRIDLENRNKQLEQERNEYEEKLKKIEAEKRKASGEPEPKELSAEEKQRIAMEVLGVTDLSEIVKKSEIVKEPTEEEKQAALQRREDEKIAYALQKGVFSKKELEEFISDSKNLTELAYSQYYQEQKNADPDLTDDDIRSEFEDRFGLNKDENSRQYKRGQQELSLLANNLLTARHGKILSFDKEYANIESQKSAEQLLVQKIQAETPRYRKDVESVYNTIKDVTVKIKGKDYKVTIPQEMIDEEKNFVLSDKYAVEQIKGGWDKEKMLTAALFSLKQQAFDLLVEQAADQYRFENEKGAHGIPDKRTTQKPDAATSTRQENLKKYHGDFLTPQN